MARRQLKTDDEEGFLRAYRDELFDVAQDHNCHISCSLVVPLHTNGLAIRMRAYDVDETGNEVCLATFDQPYPTHVANRLHAALYRAMIRLGIELRDARRREALGEA